MSESLFIALAALFGLLFGSFGNVVIWRLPRGESLSFPPSHCPSCDAPIESRDNVPVLSWLLLRGRCRTCQAPISPRYPMVELLSALLWALAAWRFGTTAQTAVAIVFFYVLLLLTFIDIDTMRLPNVLVLPLALFALAGSVASEVLGIGLVPLTPLGSGVLAHPLFVSLLGAIVCAGGTAAMAYGYAVLRKTQGFGMGDIKLLGAMGLMLGPYAALALFLGSVIGAVVGVIGTQRGETTLTTRIPFGPFLAAGAVAATLFGPELWSWYLALVVR